MSAKQLTKCHITDLQIHDYKTDGQIDQYSIYINNKFHTLKFYHEHQNNELIEHNKHIIYGLIANGKFLNIDDESEDSVLDNSKIERIINNIVIPRSPEQKLYSLLKYINSLQKFEGGPIDWFLNNDRQDHAKRLYFKNYEELIFYLFSLKDQELIKGRDAISQYGKELTNIQFTYKGLAKIIEINQAGSESRRCFVAMSFSNSQLRTRQAIRAAIENCKFDVVFIDEAHINSDITINDAIIAEIKKAKFVVADFTEHKHGVYFEAGFAIGLGKPLIFLCHQKEFVNSHFDTNHYPHILYDSCEDLIQKLQIKIEAWIM